jgi:hypothetical protein
LNQVCERWIYTCLCFGLDFDEQKRSGFRYQYSTYQIEYSGNLLFQVGGHLDQVFQALIDRSRAPLDLKDHQDNPGTSPEISPPSQAIGQVASYRRETCL